MIFINTEIWTFSFNHYAYMITQWNSISSKASAKAEIMKGFPNKLSENGII